MARITDAERARRAEVLRQHVVAVRRGPTREQACAMFGVGRTQGLDWAGRAPAVDYERLLELATKRALARARADASVVSEYARAEEKE